MSLAKRLRYWQRIFSAYLTANPSQLSFWHGEPRINGEFDPVALGPYYMDFDQKADYAGTLDEAGIPMLDYRGAIGRQYNPIAIAQYGLGNYNLLLRARAAQDPDGASERERKFLLAADWMMHHLEENPAGRSMWMHHFDWDYRDTLVAPWYSGLAQGQGISLLVRAHLHTADTRYLTAARRAWQAFLVHVEDGGVVFVDADRHLWFEEYIVAPPTHILNGFIWASWGVHDYALATGDGNASEMWGHAVSTLLTAVDRFDTGWWSLYEQSGTALPMLASSFYHRLHIVQLRVLQRLTGHQHFADVADRWQGYTRSRWKRWRALVGKVIFKLCYY